VQNDQKPMRSLGASFRERLLPIGLSQLTGVACGIAGVKIVSRLVPPETLGTYGIFLTFSTLGMWLVHAGVVRYVSRHWATAEDRRSLLHNVVRAWWRKGIWLVPLAAVGAADVARFDLRFAAGVFPPLLAAAGLLSAGALAQTALQAGREHWRDFAVSAGGSLTRTFAPPLLFVGLGAAGLYAGFCVHALTVAGLGIWALRRHWVSPAPAAGRTATLQGVYDGPLFVALAAATWGLAGVNRWIVAWAFGEATAGHFTLAGNIGLIVPAVLGAIFLQFFQPGFFALADDGSNEAGRRLGARVDAVVAGLCGAGLAGLLIVQWLAPRLVGPLIDPRYVAALDWILPAGCFGLTTAAAQFYHVMMVAIRRERACAPVDLGTAGVLVGGSVIAALQGELIFGWWLRLTPLVLIALTRPLARRYLAKPVA
jgi:O-antigen/teichoic acid export membrane protein